MGCYFDLQSIPKMLIKQCEEKVIREQQHMNIFILKKNALGPLIHGLYYGKYESVQQKTV